MLLLSDNAIKRVAIKAAYADYMAENISGFTLLIVIPICCLIAKLNISIDADYIFIKSYIPYMQKLLDSNKNSTATAHFIFYLYYFVALIFYMIKCRLPSIECIIFTLHSFKYLVAFLIFILIILPFVILGNMYAYGHSFSSCPPNDALCHIYSSNSEDSVIYMLAYFIVFTAGSFFYLMSIKLASTRHIQDIDYHTYTSHKEYYRQEFNKIIKYYLGF